MVKCPHCDGWPRREIFLCSRGRGGGCRRIVHVCHFCGGRGAVTPEKAATYPPKPTEEELIQKAVERGVIDP